MSNSRLKKRSLSQEDLFNFSELFKLMKPRVMSLVIFTCAVGLLTSPNLVSTKDAIIGILLVSLGAGAAGALNMWYESDLDALMTRTCLRPIPTGKINRNQALIFGVTLSIISVVALDYFTNRISAAILLLTILFYVFVYTIWLKRRTPQNIVIGGAAGAFPPVIGWTIATGSLSIEPLAFFLIIFFWTPSHFWALSLYKSDDYKKANIPMLPLTNGVESTKTNIFVYSLLMLPIIIFPFWINFVGLIFLVPAMLLTLYYNFLCYELYNFNKHNFDPKKAKILLAESGYESTSSFPEISLLTTNSDSGLREAEALQAMWQKHLGIKVRIMQREWTTYLQKQYDADYDICVAGWIGDYLDPTTFLEMWITDGGNNNTGWGSSEFEELLNEAENTTNVKTRMEILSQAEQTILNDTPVLPIYWYTTNYLIRPEVKGWNPLLLNNHPFKSVKLEK